MIDKKRIEKKGGYLYEIPRSFRRRASLEIAAWTSW